MNSINNLMLEFLNEQYDLNLKSVEVLESNDNQNYIVLLNYDVNNAQLINKKHFNRWKNLKNI